MLTDPAGIGERETIEAINVHNSNVWTISKYLGLNKALTKSLHYLALL